MCLPLLAAAPMLVGALSAGGAAAAGVTGMTGLLAAGSLGMGVAGAGVSAMGAQESAQASAKAANYQAQVASNNATLATQQGDANAEMAYRQGDQQLGMQRAAFGAMGVDPNSGSATQVQQATALNTGMNVANTRYDAALQSIGFRQSAALGTAQAQQDAVAGMYGVGGSLLSGATQFAVRWTQFQQTGALGSGSSGSSAATSPFPGY